MQSAFNQPVQANTIRLTSTCDLHVSNYSFSGVYWCSACSYVSQGYPECSPGLDSPTEHFLTLQAQGPPMVGLNINGLFGE